MIELDKKKSGITLKKALLFAIVFLLLIKLIFDFDGFGKFISSGGAFLISVLGYLLVGFIIAFILNAYMKIWENRVFRKMKNIKAKRIISIAIAYITLIAVVALLLFALIPTLIDTVSSLAKNLPSAFDKLLALYDDVMHNGKFDLPEAAIQAIANSITKIEKTLVSYIDSGKVTSIITSLFSTTFSGIFNMFMGIMVSFYMLLEKDNVIKALKTITIGLFSENTSKKIFHNSKKINVVFTQYFAGKLLQAIIVLFVSYIIFLIAGLDYAILFAVILGITNMIPYIGPWIGGILVVLLSLSQGLPAGITALICVLIMQVIDNTILTPNIVGGQIGISPLLVLIGLCICGGLFGLPGLILGDVFAAIIKILFYDTYVKNKINNKIENGLLPESARGEYLTHTEYGQKPTLIKKFIGLFKKRKK